MESKSCTEVELTDNKLENEKSMRRFLTCKYFIELGFMLAIFIFIFIMRYFTFMDNAIVGTLVGATIGYFARSIRKLHD